MSYPAAVMSQLWGCLWAGGMNYAQASTFPLWGPVTGTCEITGHGLRCYLWQWHSLQAEPLGPALTFSCTVSGIHSSLTVLLVLRARFFYVIVMKQWCVIIFLPILFFKWLYVHHIGTRLSSGQLTHIKWHDCLKSLPTNCVYELVL